MKILLQLWIVSFTLFLIVGSSVYANTTVISEDTSEKSQNRTVEETSKTNAVNQRNMRFEEVSGLPQTNIDSALSVTSIEATETFLDESGILQASAITFRGRAFPNTLVNLFIFSTPIIVTVQTDFKGEWTYTLREDLADGNHEIYIAHIDETGVITAKSETILFFKEASAIEIGSPILAIVAPLESGFVKLNFGKVLFVILIIGIAVALVVSGIKQKDTINPYA